LIPFLLAFLVLTFSCWRVNVRLLPMFVVPHILLLPNISYPSRWELALDRIVDVAIGGALANVAVFVLQGLQLVAGGRNAKPVGGPVLAPPGPTATLRSP
jgi:hypothetical protein